MRHLINFFLLAGSKLKKINKAYYSLFIIQGYEKREMTNWKEERKQGQKETRRQSLFHNNGQMRTT